MSLIFFVASKVPILSWYEACFKMFAFPCAFVSQSESLHCIRGTGQCPFLTS